MSSPVVKKRLARRRTPNWARSTPKRPAGSPELRQRVLGVPSKAAYRFGPCSLYVSDCSTRSHRMCPIMMCDS
jgi:hypothetical protein